MRASSKTKKNSSVQFWYPVRTIGQLTFEGQTVFVDIPQEGHILYQGRLMCRQSMERLKAEVGAKKFKTVSQRIQSIKICYECQKKFKENPDLAWAHWVKAPEPKRSATVQINPELLKGNNNDNS